MTRFLRILERMFDIPAVARAKAGLAAALESPSGLDDAGRVDAIRALEELACVVSAAQAALSVELDESQRAGQQAAGVPVAQQGRGVAAQVGLARRESHHRGQRHLGLAKVVAAELPHTWAAWGAGRITEWKATLVARETVFLSQEDRLQVDEAVAADQDRLEEMGDRQLASACQRVAYRLDPESYVARRRYAEADRRVTIRPAPDAMVWLTALLPVTVGVGAYAALTGAAASARAAGDPRTKGQVMADTLVQSVLSGAADPDAVATHDVPVPVSLGLVMTDQALFGTSDEPAYVESYGPVPAELAREIIAGACTREERVAVRRLYTSPTTGELVTMDSRSRFFAGALGRFIRLRDQTCRTPWCDAPVRHGDHAEEYAEAGPTNAVNGQGLCEACNLAKQAPGWRARPSPDPGPHEIGTTTPTGHTYRSRAPAIVAMIRESPVRLDLILAS